MYADCCRHDQLRRQFRRIHRLHRLWHEKNRFRNCKSRGMSEATAMQRPSAKKVTSALWRSLRRLASGKADACSGVAAIEFALVGPMLVVMMVCTVDLGS